MPGFADYKISPISNSDVSDTLLKLAETKIYLIPDDKIMYSVCVLNDGSGDYLKLCEKPLKIQITYTSDGCG